MPLTKPLEEVRKDLNALLVDDIAAAIKALQALLPDTSDKHSVVVALLGRLNDANKARLRNTLSNDDLQREYDKIRADFFDLVQALQAADFEALAQSDGDGQQAPQQGSILYRIPGTMPVNKETKCVVRIARDADAIAENITIDEHVQLKELYRVSDTMQAQLLDPSGGRIFRITTINEDIQIVDEHHYTEWWFYVTPLEEGTYPLILKIAIIELVNGQPRSKEIVLEETVQIIANGPVSDDADTKSLKPAGYALAFQAASVSGAGLVTQVDAAQPAGTASSSASAATTASSLSGVAKAALLTLALASGTIAGWFAVPEADRDWWKTRHFANTAAGYAAYMDQYRDGKYYEDAACKKIALENAPTAFRNYLYEFPEGKCREMAQQGLDRLEREHLEALRDNPSEDRMRAYLRHFPECENLGAVLDIVLANPDLHEPFLPMIEQRWQECRLMDPGFPEIPVMPELPTLPLPPDTATHVPAESAAPPAVPPASPQAPNNPPPPAERPAAPSVPAPEMVFVQGGTFRMGSESGLDDERPVRNVTVRDFYLGKTEVTFSEYDRFCEATGRDKPYDEGWGRGNRPVIHVSWLDAVAYCNWLSMAHNRSPVYTISAEGRVSANRSANGYRLPTEAEWEYAARAGQDYLYSGSSNLNEVAWFLDNSGSQTRPVAQKAPNAWGVHDLTGNVREWCQDWYGPYPAADANDPAGPPTSKTRVLRGGQWGRNPLQQRITYRNSAKPDYDDYGTGFRLARR